MKFSKKRIFLDSLIYTLLPKISFIAAILILPWITPYLTLKDYGIYGLIMAYVVIFHNLIVLGQNILLQNAFFTHRAKYKLVWRRSFAIMVLAGICSGVFVLFIMHFTLSDKLGSNYLFTMICLVIYLTLSPIEVILVNYYTLKEKSLPYAYGAGLIGLITTMVTLVSIKYLKMGYMGWIISLPFTVLLSYIYFFRRIFLIEKLFPQFRFKMRFFTKAIKIGLPLTPHQLSLYILGVSDRLLLEYFKVPIQQIGFYSQGYNIGSQGSILVGGVFQALTKKLQEGFRGTKREDIFFIKRIIIILPLLISCIFFIGSLWMKEFFYFLFRNPELQEAYPVSIVVLSSYMFWSIYSFFSYPLSINNQTFAISKISLVAASFNIIGNVIFIPYYGIWGSLGITYLSYIIFGFAGLLNKENREFLNRYVHITKTCIYLLMFNILLFVISFLSRDLSISFKGFITIGMFLALFSMFKMNHKKLSYNALPHI